MPPMLTMVNGLKNLSNGQLTNSETSLLAKGLGYCVVDRKVPIPVVDFVTVTESAIRQA